MTDRDASTAKGTTLVVVDAETAWIQSLFTAIPEGWSAKILSVRTVGLSPGSWLRAARETETSPGPRTTERVIAVPGWTRASRFSTYALTRAIRQTLRGTTPRAIVHSTPWTAGLLVPFANFTHVYRPHDFFGMYSWNQDMVNRGERALLANCRLVLPVSTAHATDLEKLGPAPVRVLPNGVSAEFVHQLRNPSCHVPADLADERRPIVGCVGQINSGYDLALLTALADSFPQAAFVFIGPVFDEGHEPRRRLDELFEKANVRWLGLKPHVELPNYMSRFAVCLNPLKVDAKNDRRSPLRLYDYLATGKPVLSTAISAALEHAPHVALGRDLREMANELRRLLDPDYRINDTARRSYVDANTWEARGRVLVDWIAEVAP